MRYLTFILMALFIHTSVFAAVELDGDSNSAIDVAKGGTNASNAAGARANLGLGSVDNTSDLNKPISTVTQMALNNKANTSAFANQAAFTAAWGWTPGGGTFDQAGDYTLTGSWDFSGATISGIVGSLPTGIEGQTIQYGSGGTPAAVDLAPLAFTDNVSRNATTGVVTVPVTATATSGSAVPLTSGGAYTALGGKQDTLVSGTNIKTINSTSILGSGNIDIAGGTGGYVTLSAIPYSDVACTTGQYGYYGSTAYLCTGGFWTSKWTLNTHSNAAPVTYAATLTITDASTTGDTFTLNSVAYDASDSPVSVTNLPTATEQITYTGSNTAACTGDVTGTGPWTINDSPATVGCTVTASTAASASDDFNRANGPLGANWAAITGVSAPAIHNGTVVGQYSGVPLAARWVADTFSADQSATLTINGDGAGGVMVRSSATENTYYLFATGTASSQLQKVVNGTVTQIGASYGVITTGQTMGLKIVGTTLTPYINGVAQATRTDSSISSGQPGIWKFGNYHSIDDWSAQDE